MNLMPRLLEVPVQTRAKYGKRKQNLTQAEKVAISRQRNRVHAQATRVRRTMLRKVIDDHGLLAFAPDPNFVLQKYMVDSETARETARGKSNGKKNAGHARASAGDLGFVDFDDGNGNGDSDSDDGDDDHCDDDNYDDKSDYGDDVGKVGDDTSVYDSVANVNTGATALASASVSTSLDDNADSVGDADSGGGSNQVASAGDYRYAVPGVVGSSSTASRAFLVTRNELLMGSNQMSEVGSSSSNSRTGGSRSADISKVAKSAGNGGYRKDEIDAFYGPKDSSKTNYSVTEIQAMIDSFADPIGKVNMGGYYHRIVLH